ncbi:MAG: hypothetical protein CMK32_03160 [Porticoccaceae bacterium]|nr:hypothetical protein [Porticoccaceae bacterium]
MKNAAIETEDFRVRVAREKRQRMRARLLDAVLAVYEPRGKGRAAVIDDVIREADVSRGTFYKYFETLEDAVDELGRKLAEETLGTYRDIFTDESDLLVQVAGGTVLTLSRAAMEPRWGLFTASIDFIDQFAQRDSLFPIVASTLVKAREAKLLAFDSLDGASDLVVGTAAEAIRRLAHGQHQSRTYIVEMATLCLCGLAVSRDRAERASRDAWLHLAAQAENLPWWRQLSQQ